MYDLAHTAAIHISGILAAPPEAATTPPNPGTGVQPPGTGGLVTILKWAAWLVSAVCVAGVFMVAGRMAVMHNRGEGGQHMVGIAYVLAACVLVGAASALVGALI